MKKKTVITIVSLFIIVGIIAILVLKLVLPPSTGTVIQMGQPSSSSLPNVAGRILDDYLRQDAFGGNTFSYTFTRVKMATSPEFQRGSLLYSEEIWCVIIEPPVHLYSWSESQFMIGRQGDVWKVADETGRGYPNIFLQVGCW